MFAPLSVDELDAETTASALVGARLEMIRAGARRLSLAVHWADLHAPEAEATVARGRSSLAPSLERFAPGGADGTPEVASFAVDELACYLGMTSTAAANLMRDALDLRHRHPLLWAVTVTGEVEEWRARKVVRLTREAGLTRDLARWVDAETVDAVMGLPFGRALAVVEAKVIAADPEGAEGHRQEAEARRYVAVGRSDAHGQRMLLARTAAGDIARIDAMVAHLAELLGAQDTSSLDVRRAKALALLADPARACLLLAQTQADEHLDDHLDSRPATAVELGASFGALLAELGETALRRLRPRTVLYLHLSEEACGERPPLGSEVARAEGIGALTLEQLRDWLGRDEVVVTPVLDPMAQVPVDAYEIPVRHREAMYLRQPFEVFPFGTTRSRRADLDHTRPYLSQGQTHPDNLGPLSRRHHRLKTFGRWEHHQPSPGLYLWRTPQGWWFQVDHLGTHPLGRETPTVLLSRLECAFRDVLVDAA